MWYFLCDILYIAFTLLYTILIRHMAPIWHMPLIWHMLLLLIRQKCRTAMVVVPRI
ncbi:hypothetical protein C2G38_2085287, partial [Gigaspora rosea]